MSMKTLVLYYSNKGSNEYLAEKIAQNLDCKIEAIRPNLNVHFLMLFGMSFGNKKIKSDLSKYDRIILVGPIWMGKFVSPLKSFVKKYKSQIKKLVFVTCCGSTYDKKDEKFGHGLVFNQVRDIIGDKCELCQAFPIALLMPEGHKDDSDAFMKTHLNDSNFDGEFKEEFDKFMKRLLVD